jgi:hypothetical protein
MARRGAKAGRDPPPASGPSPNFFHPMADGVGVVQAYPASLASVLAAQGHAQKRCGREELQVSFPLKR